MSATNQSPLNLFIQETITFPSVELENKILECNQAGGSVLTGHLDQGKKMYTVTQTVPVKEVVCEIDEIFSLRELLKKERFEVMSASLLEDDTIKRNKKLSVRIKRRSYNENIDETKNDKIFRNTLSHEPFNKMHLEQKFKEYEEKEKLEKESEKKVLEQIEDVKVPERKKRKKFKKFFSKLVPFKKL